VGIYPFIFMDIPYGNTLPTPYGGTTGQPLYPWRGRITCDPAIGYLGSPNKTSAAATQVAAFLGTAQASDFSVNTSGNIAYSGPSEWSLRKFLLYYASLAQYLCGGVDFFIMGSELIGSTTIRSSQSDFPTVDAFVTLATDLRGILGTSTQMSYAADWSEYFGYQPGDGSNDVYFHLDPLWASDDTDF